MKINPCIKCEKDGDICYPDFDTYPSTTFYEAACCCCNHGLEVRQDNLELCIEAWNKLNTSPREKAEKAKEAKEAWAYVRQKIEETKKSIGIFQWSNYHISKLEILDEFFNLTTAEFEEVEK